MGQLFCVTKQGKWYYKVGQVLKKGQFLLQSGVGVAKQYSTQGQLEIQFAWW